jgi:hypothetical protein
MSASRPRAARLGAAICAVLTSFAFAADAGPTSTPACDRACLRQVLDAYLTAVFEHDPAAAPLAEGSRATEDAFDTPNGAGFWTTISGYGELQRRYFDPVYETAAYLGVLKEKGQDVIASVRIRVANRKVSEAEWTIAQQGPGGHGSPDLAGMLRNPPPSATLPPSERASRFVMLSLANDYFQALQDHDGAWVPHDSHCDRIENGVKTTFRPPSTPAASGTVSGTPTGFGHLSGGCLDNFAAFNHNIAELTLRRFPLVDEEAGMVMGATIFLRYPDVPEPRNLINEYFYVPKGRISGIWSVMYYLAPSMPLSSGWENK